MTKANGTDELDAVAAALAVHDDADPGAFELPGELAALIDAYELASAQAKEADELKKAARDRLVEIAQAHDANRLTRDGRVVATVTTVVKHSFDSRKFKIVEPELYERYLKTSEVTTFNLKK